MWAVYIACIFRRFFFALYDSALLHCTYCNVENLLSFFLREASCNNWVIPVYAVSVVFITFRCQSCIVSTEILYLFIALKVCLYLNSKVIVIFFFSIFWLWPKKISFVVLSFISEIAFCKLVVCWKEKQHSNPFMVYILIVISFFMYWFVFSIKCWYYSSLLIILMIALSRNIEIMIIYKSVINCLFIVILGNAWECGQ